MTITEGLQDVLEENLARKLAPAMRDARRRIQQTLDRGDLTFADVEALPLDLFDDITSAWQSILEDQLSEAYIQAANEFADGINYAVDPALLEDAARGWASAYSYDLAQQLNSTSRTQLNGVIQKFFDGSMTNQELTERLTRIYGPRRANTIAITEVTRAAAEGQSWVARQLGAQGVNLIGIWQTRQDEFVCPVCGPRHDNAQGTNWFMLPPAHPNCRCGVRYVVVLEDAKSGELIYIDITEHFLKVA